MMGTWTPRLPPGFVLDRVLVFFSVLLMILFFPFSLFLAVKVSAYTHCILWHETVQVIPEYQRAVIFRLGRVEDGDAKGPGNLNMTYKMHPGSTVYA